MKGLVWLCTAIYIFDEVSSCPPPSINNLECPECWTKVNNVELKILIKRQYKIKLKAKTQGIFCLWLPNFYITIPIIKSNISFMFYIMTIWWFHVILWYDYYPFIVTF